MVTPIEMPEPTMGSEMAMELERFQMTGDEYGGAGQTVTYADDRWICTLPFSGFPTREAQDVWKAFAGKLGGVRVPALVWDAARPVPLGAIGDDGKPVSGSPWGSPTYAAHSRSNSTFDLAGLTAGWALYAGDYFSVQDSADVWRLHRLTADATPDESGDVTVNVEPRPARGLTVTVGDDIRMRKALCQMVLRFPRGAFSFGGNNGAPFTVQGYEVSRAFV